MNGLFRIEAQENCNKRLYGSISLAQPLSVHLLLSTVLFVVIAVIVFLYSSEYARKETVRGYLLPDAGIIKTYPVKGGVVTELHVKEGDKVVSGQPIAVISVQSGTVSGEEIGEKIVSSLLSKKTFYWKRNSSKDGFIRTSCHALDSVKLTLIFHFQYLSANQK
ncbi:HlyD family secretion protein [Shewanella algae]|uniref:hypothetical protein n=1 Tax=Shewanella algae TaxID=38313 RepID=UPI0021B1E2A7|nr:hypothetical protein [Shewanella algae]